MRIDGHGRKWAIKVLHALAGGEAMARRFERGAHAALTLDHPNIARMADFVTHPGEPPYLVMGHLVGCSLHEVLKRKKRLTPRHAVRIALQVLAALEAAHAAGVVHRDIKRENIYLVAADDGGDLVKVLDFGAPKLLSEATGKPLTVTGMVVGTLSFMPPEQALARALDARADLYALAVTQRRTPLTRPSRPPWFPCVPSRAQR